MKCYLSNIRRYRWQGRRSIQKPIIRLVCAVHPMAIEIAMAILPLSVVCYHSLSLWLSRYAVWTGPEWHVSGTGTECTSGPTVGLGRTFLFLDIAALYRDFATRGLMPVLQCSGCIDTLVLLSSKRYPALMAVICVQIWKHPSGSNFYRMSMKTGNGTYAWV